MKYSLLNLRVKHALPQTAIDYVAMETMGDRIRMLREAKGYTQDALAAALKVSKGAISQWENGQTKNIKNLTFLALCQLLGTDQQYLLFGPSRGEAAAETGRFRIKTR